MVWERCYPNNRPMIRDDRTDVMFENENTNSMRLVKIAKDCVAQSTSSYGYRVS